jgi:hypothetical protein
MFYVGAGQYGTVLSLIRMVAVPFSRQNVAKAPFQIFGTPTKNGCNPFFPP